MTDITNTDRASWAAAALETFIEQTGPDDDASIIADLVADLGHYCDTNHLDFIDIVARGIGHWHAEMHPCPDEPLGFMPDVTISIDGGAS